MKLFIKLLFAVILSFAIIGCSSKPTHLELVVKSAEELNQDINNVSSPLMLTFYELESAEKFLKYDYWTLLSKAGKNLQQDLVSQAKHVIVPQEEQTYKIAFSDRTNFLGVVGKFRNIKSDSIWKYVITLEKEEFNYSELKVENYKIERVE